MLGEIGIGAVLFILIWNKIIDLKLACFICSIIYWIPKELFIKYWLNGWYPSILTHQNHNLYSLPFKKSQGNNKKISLTFDDVPYGNSFEQILDILDMYDMKATFFVISDYVTEKNRHLLLRAVRSGHQLGNHGKTNSNHYIKSHEKLQHEIDTCDKFIKSIYNECDIPLPKIMVYRPGCGLFHNKMIKYINDICYHLTLGSVYPNDPIIRSPTINYYYLINHIEDGDIIILHDRTWTVPLLQKLLPWCFENNFTSVTVNTLMQL